MEMERDPDIVVRIWISDIGIEYKLYGNFDGNHAFTCRSFKTDRNRIEMLVKLRAWLVEILDIFRKIH